MGETRRQMDGPEMPERVSPCHHRPFCLYAPECPSASRTAALDILTQLLRVESRDSALRTACTALSLGYSGDCRSTGVLGNSICVLCRSVALLNGLLLFGLRSEIMNFVPLAARHCYFRPCQQFLCFLVYESGPTPHRPQSACYRMRNL